ncbi:uncharacterized protein RJT21DRAFT_117931 [Scheffersomyces amazonensis]|uniref:uncharacterized protein n=1 Tax=Scheffersomyces amazonensis TaxID=1078765 RepID=UPI00315D2E64
MLKINLKDNSLSYKIAKKNSKNFSLFKKVELSSICTSLEALEQLKGIFVGVTSLSLDPIHLSETTLYPVVSIFCSQNIREVEIKNCCTLQKEDSLFKLFKAMPNIRVLVLQSSDSHVPAMVNFAILNLPNYSLQKFSLDMETPVPASELKEQLALVRTMVQYWGSTLELIRIHRVRPQEKVSLLTVDLFHYQQYYTKKEFDEEISRLISHLLQYQKLKTFVFYDNQYLRKHRQDWIRWTDLSIKK